MLLLLDRYREMTTMKFISLFVLAYSSIVDALAYHSALTNEKPMSRRNVLGAAVVTSAASLLLGGQAQAAVDGNSDVDVDTQVYFGVGVGAEGCFFLFFGERQSNFTSRVVPTLTIRNLDLIDS